jgi:arylsulfatase
MAETQTDVLVAVYQDLDEATRDFDGLMQIVKAKQVEVEGAILVTHDASGGVTVVQHGDHLGRKGLGWGAGAGLVVGLFAPPLLASVVVGGVAGGLIGKFTDHKVRAGMEKLGDKLPPGTAGTAVFDEDYRLAIERALPGSPAKSVAQTDKQGSAR